MQATTGLCSEILATAWYRYSEAGTEPPGESMSSTSARTLLSFLTDESIRSYVGDLTPPPMVPNSSTTATFSRLGRIRIARPLYTLLRSARHGRG